MFPTLGQSANVKSLVAPTIGNLVGASSQIETITNRITIVRSRTTTTIQQNMGHLRRTLALALAFSLTFGSTLLAVRCHFGS